MKMLSSLLKGVAGAWIIFYTFMNQNFGPLIWVLLALIAIDLLINAKDEDKAFKKIIQGFVSVGLPSFIANSITVPHFMTYATALLCLVYLEVDGPQILALLTKFKLRGKLVFNSEEQAIIKKTIAAASARVQAQAEKTLTKAPKSTEQTAADILAKIKKG